MIVYIILFLFLLSALGVLLVPVFSDNTLPWKQKQHFIAAVSGIFVVGVFGFYQILGAPGLLPQIAEHNVKMAEVQKSMHEQASAIKSNPKDLASWVGLGQSYMQSGDYKNASKAFKQAVLLSKGNPLIILAYATAMISEADGKVTDDAKKSLEMVLLQQPENPEARYFLTLRMLQDGNTESAMKNMKELYRSLPDGSPLKNMIDRQIGRK